MRATSAGSATSPFRQPKAVFAVAFACVESFMGIGLVDPILPAISHELHASPSEVTLLFTSYLVVTAVAMLITNRVSSRLGAKKTLIAGLILIVIFSALAGRGLAPYAAGRLVIALNIHVPFFIAAGALVAGIAILATTHGLLGAAERVQAGHAPATAEGRREEVEEEAMVVAEGSET